jgi:hypothetical protein
MRVPETHIINRQVFDFRMESNEQALGFRRELQDVYQTKLLQVIESVFDRVATNGQIIRIDKLELDLGSLEKTDWEKQLIEKVEAVLFEQISRYKSEHNITVPETVKQQPFSGTVLPDEVMQFSQEQSSEEAATLEEAILYYLENGHLPWFIADENTEPDPERYFISLLKTQPQRLISRMQASEQTPVLFIRMLRQFSASTIQLFLEKAAAENQWPEIAPVLQTWNSLTGSKPLAADPFRVYVVLTSPRAVDELVTVFAPENRENRMMVLLNRCIEIEALQEKVNVRTRLQQTYVTLLEKIAKKSTVYNLDTVLRWFARFESRSQVTPASWPGESTPLLETWFRQHTAVIADDNVPAVLKQQAAAVLEAVARTAKKQDPVTGENSTPLTTTAFPETDELAEAAWEEDETEPEVKRPRSKKKATAENIKTRRKNKLLPAETESRIRKTKKQEEEPVAAKRKNNSKNEELPAAKKKAAQLQQEEQPLKKKAVKTEPATTKRVIEPGKPFLAAKQEQAVKKNRTTDFTALPGDSTPSDYEAPKWFGDPKRIITRRAGIVLVAPYFPSLFENLGYLDKEGLFASDEIQQRAVHLLNHIAGGKTRPHEYTLALPKMLCGMQLQQPVPRDLKLSKNEKQEATELLDAVAQMWTAMKTESGDALRQAFMQRNGILEKKDGAWLLRIERTTIDIMLDTLPWSLSMIKHSWMNTMLHIEW